MEDARPSRTALRVAMRRAAHQLLDRPRVLDDPVALPILSAQAIDRLKADLSGRESRLSRAIRAFMVVRSRFAEDELARALARGATQYVVLGAGLDTFAYRNPHPAAGLRVFEVDHPATQAWKRRRLAEAAITIPSSLVFAPVDFERQTLERGLELAGFDRTTPSFFSWLGVTMYLSTDAIATTLAFVAGLPPASGIVFDYVLPRSALGWTARLALAGLSRRVAAAGEPFRTFFEPAALGEQLRRAGFRAVEDLGPDELNARYFSGRADGLRVGGRLGRLCSAAV
jgi:methyltransferase (TIGR00027 family)